MYKTTLSSGNCLGLTLAVIVFFVGIVVIFVIPGIGQILGPLLIVASLFMGGKRQKVWKCSKCGAVANRD